MPTPIYLIKTGMTMTEGVVEEWYIADGAQVTQGDLLYRLETEKINLDVDAETDGTVKHLVDVGVTKEPGDVVGYIFAAGEEIPADFGADAGGATAVAPAATITDAAPVTSNATVVGTSSVSASGRLLSSPAARRLANELGVDIATCQGTGPNGRIIEADVTQAANQPAIAGDGGAQPSSPVARKLARELGVDLATVRGTGPGGRITKDDVEAAHIQPPQAVAAASSIVAGGNDREIPLTGMRKTIAKRMHESLQSMAQLTMDMDVNMDDAIKMRAQLIEEWEEEGIKPTYTDFVIRACAKALAKHASMNASITDTHIIEHGSINVGLAVALESGLIVPVVKHANMLPMRDLSQETMRLARAARDGNLGVEDLQDGTFTVSALGMFGVDSFTPIINSPQAGIVGINRIRDGFRWDGDTPVKTQTMRLSLTWDHRVLDGAPAAEFLGEVRSLLEAPFRLLI